MSFPVDITSALTGATKRQLQNWRSGAAPLLVPEYGIRPQALYSFRDLLALRTVAKLRKETSLQKIRRAFRALQDMDLTEHPSSYTLIARDNSIYLVEGSADATDLVKHPGQRVLATLDDVFAPFLNFREDPVVNFIHPRERLEVREGRIGGWPTIRDTRVPFDTIACLVATGDIPASEVSEHYPTVSASDVADAVDFRRQIEEIGKSA